MLLGFGLSAPAWLALLDYVQGSARAAQDSVRAFPMASPRFGAARLHSPELDSEMGRFFHAPHSAYRDRTGVRARAARCFAGGTDCFRPRARRRIKWELGLLRRGVDPFSAANRRRVSMEFSLAAFVACRARALRRGIIAVIRELFGRAHSPTGGDWFHPVSGRDCRRLARWSESRVRRFPLSGSRLASLLPGRCWNFRGRTTIRAWAPAVVTIASFLATYLCLPPNCGVPKYNLSQELTQPAPLDPQRLYLSVYPPPERRLSSRKKSGTLRHDVAHWQHLDVGRRSIDQRLQPHSTGRRRSRVRLRHSRRNFGLDGSVSPRLRKRDRTGYWRASASMGSL